MGLPPRKARGAQGGTLEGGHGPHPGRQNPTPPPHPPFHPLTAQRKGKELMMALFLRCVQRCFLARRNSQPSPPVPGLRTHRRADATGEMRGDGLGGGANSSALLAEVLLARTPGSGSALPAAGPAPPGCPGKDSTSGTELSAGQLPRLKHHCLTPAAAAAPLHAPAAPKPPPQSPDGTHGHG